MKKVIFFAIFIILVIGAVLIIDQGIMKNEKSEEKTSKTGQGIIREPVATGAFYPNNEAELSSMIEGFLEKVELPELDKNIQAIIVPHAGYVYSGQIAAYAYKILEGKDFKELF